MKLKHKLPVFSILEHLQLTDTEMSNIVSIVNDSEALFISVLEANKKLCGVHHELAKSVYDNFFQISLTESSANLKDVTLDDCEVDAQSYKGVSGVKAKKLLSEQSGSIINERDYKVKTDFYLKYKDLLEPILSKFKSVPTRIRLVKLNAGSTISPHIDYDPSYAVRVIIPVISNKDCVNLFWIKNDVESVVFEPGRAYFLNTGYKHAVVNFSKEDRYTFMISVDGTKDIEHLLIS